MLNHKLRFEIGVGLDVGRARRGKPNQDSVGYLLPGLFNSRPPLFVLADGMGGYQGGATASRAIIRVTKEVYQNLKIRGCDEAIPLLIHQSHQEIRSISKKNPDLASMGSTIVIGILQGPTLFWGNVGDSRIYIINSEKIKQVSVDQSYVNKQVSDGVLTQTEARNHPLRNRLTMSISAARDQVEPNLGANNIGINDVVLFCSDGLWGTVSDAQLQAVALELPPQKAADKLIALANANLGPDNISLIVIRNKKFSYSLWE